MKASAGSPRLRLLFLSPRFLYPLDTGGKIRTGRMLEELNKICDVTLISHVDPVKDGPFVGEMSRLCADFHAVPWTEVTKYSPRFYGRVLRNLFSRYPMSVVTDYSPGLEAKVREVLGRRAYDLLVCDFLQGCLNVERVSGPPMLLFEHNAESVIPRRHFEVARDPVSKLFWWLQWKKVERYERRMCQRFDGIMTVSPKDKELLETKFGARRVFCLPTGVDTEYFQPNGTTADASTAVFTGSMDWLPNEDGILFFAREIFGRVTAAVPGARMTVVGRNPSERLLRELEGHREITTTGWVNDVRPFLASHAVYVVPLRIGSGTRMKIYEAMAMGKAVVSTTVGAEGLPLKHGEHLVLADDPHSFAEAVTWLMRDSSARARLGEAAREFVREHFGWNRVAAVFAQSCRETVLASTGRREGNAV